MKMAKASEADLDMAIELCCAIDAITGNWPTMPDWFDRMADGDAAPFDCDDDGQCGMVLRYLIATAERASLSRVVWGMKVLLAPSNKVVDPDADTLEHHPEVVAALKLAEQPAGEGEK